MNAGAPPEVAFDVIQILPGQAADPHEAAAAGWRRMIASILLDAIQVLYKRSDVNRREALRWIRERDVGLVTFDEAAEYLRFDSRRAREKILDAYNEWTARQGGTHVETRKPRRVSCRNRKTIAAPIPKPTVPERIRRIMEQLPEPGRPQQSEGRRIPFMATLPPRRTHRGGDGRGSDPLQEFMRRYG